MRERETDKARARERERRARGNRKYGQAPLKHAKRGIISCGIAGVNFLAITLMILGAYRSVGSLGSVIGGLACVSMILSGLGVYAAVRGFREREKTYLTCKIGIGCNLAILIGYFTIFIRGILS